MSEAPSSDRLRAAGSRAWQTLVVLVSAVLVALLFTGMAYLVYRGELSEGPLVLFSGVVLGYLLRVVQDYV